MVYFKDWNDSLKAEASLGAKCSKDPIEILEVIEDWEKPPKQRQGIVHCYCLTWYNENGNIDGTIPILKAAGPKLTENPCEEWLWTYQNSFYLVILTGALVGVINGLVVFIFENVAPLEKCLTFAAEDMGIFQRITMIQFMNMGCLFLISDFTIGYSRDEFPLPILVGNHRDFDTGWF